MEPTATINSKLAVRLSSAGLRAVAQEHTAELRGQRLELDGNPIGLVVPYLARDPASLSGPERRGFVDALALRLRFSDRQLHLELTPTEPIERIVFDIAEQIRCEALVAPSWQGVKSNLTAAFEDWNSKVGPTGSIEERLTESGVGLLIFTITQMLRARLLGYQTSQAIDEVIETTRGNLSKLVGHALKQLPSLVTDQAAYAVPAAEIARLLAVMVQDAAERELVDKQERARLLIPLDWDSLDFELSTATTTQALTVPLSDYEAFSRAHDVYLNAESLYPNQALRKLRSELTKLYSAQTVSLARLSLRLQALFGSVSEQGWSYGQTEGILDSNRLAQLVADPREARIYKQPAMRPTAETTITFLVDTSGSMKLQRYQGVAVLVDTLVRALEMAGITSEVLGFSTTTWGGGKSRQEWQTMGSPAGPDGNPGRLADLAHIVYKSAEQSWRQARFALAAMLRTDHYREGVDGEAVSWALSRLNIRPERRKVLVLISDGYPMESSTARANRDGYLLDHLRWVWETASRQNPKLELGAITLEQDLSGILTPTTKLDLSDDALKVDTYNVLHNLFAR